MLFNFSKDGQSGLQSAGIRPRQQPGAACAYRAHSKKCSSSSSSGSPFSTASRRNPMPLGRRPPRKSPPPAAHSPAKCIDAVGTAVVSSPARWRRGWPSGWPRNRPETPGARWRYPPSGESTEMPAARISSGASPARSSTMSRSWIIRSRTTSTSRLRGVNTLMRWTSKNSGSVVAFFRAATAGLNRSRWPTCRIRPCARAVSTKLPRRSQVRRDRLLHQHVQAGFEQLAAHRGVRAGGNGHDGRVRPARKLGPDPAPGRRNGLPPPPRAPDRGRSPPASSAPSDWLTTRMWFCPNCPAPTTATRSFGMCFVMLAWGNSPPSLPNRAVPKTDTWQTARSPARCSKSYCFHVDSGWYRTCVAETGKQYGRPKKIGGAEQERSGRS